LRSDWVAAGRVSLDATPEARARIDALTTPLPTGTEIALDTLTDRAAMLSDLRDRVALITSDLSAIAERMRDCAER
jgi:hypothetical protein